MSDLVLCAGIPRSGSTWAYNATRLLLARRGAVHAAWIDDWERGHPAPVHVVKLHAPDDGLAARAVAIVTGTRDLRDIAASAMRRDWTTAEHALAFLEEVVAMRDYWRSRSTREVVYERMIADPAAEITALGAALGVPVDATEAASLRAEIDALRLPEGRYDRQTLLHPGHLAGGRVGGYADLLPQALIDEIERRWGE